MTRVYLRHVRYVMSMVSTVGMFGGCCGCS
jgi:hypothetical protein